MVSVKDLSKALASAIRLGDARVGRVTLAYSSTAQELELHVHNGWKSFIEGTDHASRATARMRVKLVVHLDGPDAPRDFVVSVKAKDLRDALKGHTSKVVTLRHEDRRLTLAGANGMLNAIDALGEEWPAMRVIDGVTTSLPAEGFVPGLKYAARAMSRDETRFHLCGVYLDAKERAIVATDGHRLHAHRWSEATAPLPQSYIVPDDAVRAACDMFEDEGSDVQISGTEQGQWLELEQGNILIQARATDSKFPPWLQVVPAAGTFKVCASGGTKGTRKLLSAAFKVVGTQRGISLTVNGRVEYKGSTADGATTEGTLPMESSHSADAVTIGVAPRYLEDALACGDVARLWVPIDPLSPMRIDCLDSGVERFAVVMPMRI